MILVVIAEWLQSEVTSCESNVDLLRTVSGIVATATGIWWDGVVVGRVFWWSWGEDAWGWCSEDDVSVWRTLVVVAGARTESAGVGDQSDELLVSWKETNG